MPEEPSDKSATAQPSDRSKAPGFLEAIGRKEIIIIVFVVAIVLLAMYAAVPGNSAGPPVVIFTSALMLALAASFVGGLLGFLFGIPRRLQGSGAQDATDLGLGPGYDTNTNLEQISDWLTKILVGVGLVQLAYLGTILDSLGQFVEGALGTGAGRVVGICIVILFLILGLLLAYVLTRTRLAEEFSEIEREGRVQPQFYEGLMHAYLYLPMPIGFQKTLDTWEKFQKRFPDARNDRAWTYVACAYGQKFIFSNRPSAPDKAILEECKANALEAIRLAIAYDPNSIEGLALLLNGGDGGDLLPFKSSKEFQDLVAPRVSSPALAAVN